MRSLWDSRAGLLYSPLMAPDNSHRRTGVDPIFTAVLTPHRSLTPRGLAIVMGAIGVCSFITGTIFYVAGAWPVMGFMGLDVALIYVAFRLNNRQARAFEEISMTREALTVRKVSAAGHWRRFRFRSLLDAAGGRAQARLGRYRALARREGRPASDRELSQSGGTGEFCRCAVRRAYRGADAARRQPLSSARNGWRGRVAGLDTVADSGANAMNMTTAIAPSPPAESEFDYPIVRDAIEFISRDWREQPSLEQIASHVGMQPLALQRLFTRWAGLTPKGFLQAVTLDHARRLLKDSASVLDAESGARPVRAGASARSLRRARGDDARRFQDARRRGHHPPRLPSLAFRSRAGDGERARPGRPRLRR